MSTSGTQTVYLFECRNDPALLAVSLHRSAGNIPPSTAWYAGWRLRAALSLDLDAPGDGDTRRIANRVRSDGYYIWREGASSRRT